MSTAARPALAAASASTAASTMAKAPAADAQSDLHALELDSDIITSVRLDGLALTKIVKHCRDAHPASASGALLGMDLGGTLEISNVFALPNPGRSSGERDEEEDRSSRNATRYTSDMVRLLRDVNADANPVGLYQGCFLGAFLNSSVVDSLAAIAGLMERDGASGRGKGVLIVHDLAQSAQGSTSVKAYRLSPSFVEAHKKGKFHTQSLIDYKLTFANILIEIPVSLRNTALLDAFLSSISTPSAPGPSIVQPSTSDLLRNPPTAALTPSYTSLNLALEPVLASSLESTLEIMDEHAAEAGNVGFQARQLAREKAKAEAYLARKKAEYAAREAQGLAPVPVEDVNRLFKIPAEPSRLEATLLLGQIDSSAKRLSETAALGIIQLNAAKTGAV
ncbi:related to translation initiation factor eIF3 p40 subunit [Melanopsichium pennsylvanicum]|uniref:Eukaryotic translation initiation factor 3 subunit H n=2 Tax=Melanopsichium pennsylvanicum TaxID=63383 RepID=A0AAJ5C2K2_9BASI|nr:related to eIF3h-translation initiation factor 3 subunit H [Melanopsichium pennsylvanicum 4]SNX81509.1 related to translation initiation factor eIF3 p40 subunit [Melanopsichium pennsylvanicum]